MTLGLISLGVQGLPALFQTGIGISQQIQANKELKNLKYPLQNMPSGMNAAKNIYAGLAGQDQIPGISNAIQNFRYASESKAGDALRSGMSSQDIMSLLATLGQSEMGYGAELAVETGKNFQQNQQKYAEFMQNYASAQNDLFKQNVMNPYLMKREQALGQYQSGTGNISGGVTGMGNAISGSVPYIAAGNDWDVFAKIMAAKNA